MIKLIASDIDGTLVPEGTTSIDPEFYEIIRKLKKKGILFAGASGRQYSSMRALLDPVFDDIIFISGNGTNIMRKGEKLYSMGMNQADVAKLIAYMRTLPDCIFTASTLDGIYYEQQDEDFERLQVEGYHNQIHLVKDVTKEPVEIQKLALYRKAGIAAIGDAVEARLEGYLPGVSGRRVLDRFCGSGGRQGKRTERTSEHPGDQKRRDHGLW